MRPPRWFVKELQLIDRGLTVRWNNENSRWIIYHQDGSPSHIVARGLSKLRPLGTFIPLDQRILRKVRIDKYFTHNRHALDKFLQEDDYALRVFVDRGFTGLSSYLAGLD